MKRSIESLDHKKPLKEESSTSEERTTRRETLQDIKSSSWGSLATCKNFREMVVGGRIVLVKKKGICLKCLKSLQRIKHKDIADCKWSNCDNFNQNHHPLLCDRPKGSQAVLKASYEEDTGEEEDRND